nr:lipid-transfer protein [bacterium]
MSDVIVAGVGLHPWGKFPEKSWVEMGAEVAMGAVADAGMEWTDVEAMVSGAMQWGGSTGMRSGNTIAAALGETGVPIANINNACASGGSLMRAAYAMITSGMHDSVLVIGTDKSPKGYFPSVPVLADEPRPPVDMVRWQVGVPNPAYWALEMRKRMEAYGSTDEHLAQVKVKNSRHGSLNPYARYRKAFTLEQVMASPMVCDPLRLLEICATSDGAAAVVLVSDKKARRLGVSPLVKVAACSLASGEFGDPTIRIPLLAAASDGAATAPLLSESRLAAQMAYEQAGLGPEDMDFVELPDNSSWHELQYLETMGFCDPGEAEKLLDAGETALGGRLPVCPSGGFSSFGEATMAQGILQIVEVTWQLRGTAGARQVEGATKAITEVYGAQANNSACILTT